MEDIAATLAEHQGPHHRRVGFLYEEPLFQEDVFIIATEAIDDQRGGWRTFRFEPPSHARLVSILEESDAELALAVEDGQTDRVRFASATRVPEPVRLAAARAGCYLAMAPVVMEGRVELLWYVFEQSLCVDYHRYGNLGARAAENRAPVS